MLKEEERLIYRLKEYSKSDYYPFHMPGHKRNRELGREYENPFSVDITEIHGFDNLHHPEGIIKESMEWAASVYGADRTYYLVNGSSCGILSAICGTTGCGGTILMSRNCHKAAYNGVFLNHLKVDYVYPQIIGNLGIQGGILPEDVDRILADNKEIESVLIVSPTYDGIVSDVEEIARVVHRHGKPLIVDEAHGAHFPFCDQFPKSALELGADVVVQSLHKTLPCFTQTAVLHIKGDRVKAEEIERYLRIYQSSSPSYVFLAGIENCIFHMDREGRQRMERFYENVCRMRTNLKKMHRLYLLDREWIGSYGVFDMDMSKIVVSVEKTDLTGADLDRILRERYHLELEMCCADHVVAITSLGDREEGFRRLEEALLELDGQLNDRDEDPELESDLEWSSRVTSRPEVEMTIFEGIMAQKESVPVEEGVGRIAGEFVFIYPPGIPIVAPGEMLLPSLVHTIEEYQEMGLSVQGLKDLSGKTIQVVKRL